MHHSPIMLAIFVSIVQAFTSHDWSHHPNGPSSISHRTITRRAFNNMAQVYWPDSFITRRMVHARDIIITANIEVDDDQYYSARHFDAENFDGGQFVLTGTPIDAQYTADEDDVDLLHQIFRYLDTHSIAEARIALGKALHSIQDFYSHSNWVEMGNTVPHPGLGRVNGTIIYVPETQDTCTPCGHPLSNNEYEDCNDCDRNIIVQGLTSGYYPDQDRSPLPNVAKCRHGGPWNDEGALPGSSDGINKDRLECDSSSHGPKYHIKAAELAILASEQFINDIRVAIATTRNEDIAEQQMRLLFGVDAVFVSNLGKRQVNPSSPSEFAPVLTVSNFGTVTLEYRRKYYSYSVPVDGFTEIIRFALQGDYTITVSRPDGSIVESGDPDVDISVLSDTTVLIITSPLPGSWGVLFNGVGQFSLSVSVQSSIHFSFSFAEIRGRLGHSGWAPNPEIVPMPGIDFPVLADLEGGEFSNVTHQIRNENGDILNDNLPLLQGSGELGRPSKNSFFGFINIPSRDCHVYVTGNDSAGYAFIRHYPIPVFAKIDQISVDI